jgi:hypothetical protein
LNADPVIARTLFNALAASVGSVPEVRREGDTVRLSVGGDAVACSSGSCALHWDSGNPRSPEDSASFQSALYEVLLKWSTSDGASDPAIHHVVYRETGSVKITLSEGYGSQDEVECSAIAIRGGTPYRQCSLVVSEISTGTEGELPAMYQRMLASPSLIADEIGALLAVVHSSRFLPPGSRERGNGFFQLVQTIYTDMVQDSLILSANYAYATPERNGAGQIIADGVTLSLTASQDAARSLHVQQAELQTYALARRP